MDDTQKQSPDKIIILNKLDSIFENVQSSLESCGEMNISLVSRKLNSRNKKLTFPGRRCSEAWMFTAFLKIMNIAYECVLADRIYTKRDVYYRDVNLFRKQSVVDNMLNDLAATLGVRRASLNIVAAAKGLVTGNIQLYMQRGSVLCCNRVDGGLLIPHRIDIRRIEISASVKWIVLLEKEAIFHEICDSPSSRFKESTIFLTGKGYPDIATREFLVLLSETTGCPVFALVDLDPHGIDIISTYKFGSASMFYESSYLKINCLDWLGLKYEDLRSTVCGYQHANHQGKSPEGLLAMSSLDRRKANAMLQRDCINDQSEWRLELQRMLFSGVKAEIEILNHCTAPSLIEWIQSRICLQ
ncbi:Spo11/DNA topoisomerase VI subunit A [Geopyxis carbonaria]|nr:Spo11/DNA topoisomerase VI subunit A [Geopyxis carbonaria]